MIPVLNMLGTHCGVFGNHDFGEYVYIIIHNGNMTICMHLDFGLDTLAGHIEKTDTVWLLSNVTDNETGRPLADGKVHHTMEDWVDRSGGERVAGGGSNHQH